jgi:hypothetical protein
MRDKAFIGAWFALGVVFWRFWIEPNPVREPGMAHGEWVGTSVGAYAVPFGFAAAVVVPIYYAWTFLANRRRR